MLLIFNIVLCVFLLAIVIQDFKHRAVHIFLLAGIFLVTMTINWFLYNEWFDVRTFLYLGFTSICVWIYLSIKEGKMANPFIHYIGLGDILFLLAVAPLFTVFSFVVFIVSGMLLSIALGLLFRKKISTDMIPLAGILAGYLLVMKATSIGLDLDIFHQTLTHY